MARYGGANARAGALSHIFPRLANHQGYFRFIRQDFNRRQRQEDRASQCQRTPSPAYALQQTHCMPRDRWIPNVMR
ncbi:hypothetical protein D3C85_1724490 [compost metagenome]